MKCTSVGNSYRLRLGYVICCTLAVALGCVHNLYADDDDIVNAMGFEPNPPYGFTTTFNGTVNSKDR